MDLRPLISHFTYRIEPKPEGGFIAHATDPTVPPIEAPTREELQRRIQSTIAAGLAAQFPGLQLPGDNRALKFAFHVEPKAGGGFVIHSSDPNSNPIEGASHEEIENPFAEKLINFVGKHFLPELAQALAAQGGSADIQVFTDRKGAFSIKTGSGASTPDRTGNFGSFPSTHTSNANTQPMVFQDTAGKASPSIARDGFINAPITPESSGGSSIFRFLLTLLVIACLIYFFLHRH